MRRAAMAPRWDTLAWAAAASALAVATALLPGWTGASARSPQSFHSAQLQRQGVSVVRDLPASDPGNHPRRTRPAITRHLGSNGHGGAGGGGSAPASQLVTDTAATGAAATQSVLTSFTATGLDQQVRTLGSNQAVAPPDTMLAAGPTSLLELINDSGSVYSKSGTRTSLFSLYAFFKVPQGQTFSDPRVIYDAPAGRWFASGLSFDSAFGSTLYIAVSSGGDPSGAWTIYSGATTSNVLHDQPKIGVSADKLVASWNDFLSARAFEGASTWVVQKSDLLNAIPSAHVSASGPDASKTSLVPVQDLSYASTDTTAYDVYNTPPNIGVLAITGTPAQGNVSEAETDLGIGATSTPPAADQPGSAASIDTNDDRFLSAVWQGGTLWTSGNDACTPSSDTTVRACARLVAVTTGTMTVSQSFDLADNGADLYYPAVTLDSGGHMAASYAISSTSVYPGVRVIGMSGGTLTAGQTLQPGQAAYNDNPCYGVSGPSRWGDYFAAAVDPANPADFWLAGEFSVASTLPLTAGCAWSTFAAEMTFASAPPPPTGSPSPSSSPASLTYADQLVSTTSPPQQVTVSNASTATAPLVISGVSIGGGSSGDFVVPAASDHCSGQSIAAGASCTVAVEFAPTATGTRTAVLDVSDNASGSPQTVALSGTGADFSLTSTPVSVSFGIGSSGSFTVTVTPSPAFAASFSVSASSSSGRLTVSPTSTTCSTTGSPCTTVAFRLTASRVGGYTVTITVSDGGVTHVLTVTVNVSRH